MRKYCRKITDTSGGMWTLKMDGIIKVFMGLTDMEHILKVCI
jgi:hypothetical protein